MEHEGPSGLPSSERDLLPCHYFDFMYGTSTGGLISIMLGRLRMSIGECLEQYCLVGDKLFGHKNTGFPLRTKYGHKPLEEAVQDIVRQRNLGNLHPWEATNKTVDGQNVGVDTWSGREAVCGPPLTGSEEQHEPTEWLTDMRSDSPLRESSSIKSSFDVPDRPARWNPDDPRVCQTCCLTAVHNGSIDLAYLLRSYPLYLDQAPSYTNGYNDGAEPLAIWQVTRATSAAPFYFDMLQTVIEGELTGFKDGGIRENNPSVAAYSEFLALYDHRKQTPIDPDARPAVLLSIGTGRADTSRDGFMTTWPGPFGSSGILHWLFKGLEKFYVLPNLFVKFTESERNHQHMLLMAKGDNTWYKRLNVSAGLENMPLDDWVRGVYQGSDQPVPGGKSLGRMEDATRAYLDRERDARFEGYAAPRQLLQETARKLVLQRRARMRIGGKRWDTYLGRGLGEEIRGRQGRSA